MTLIKKALPYACLFLLSACSAAAPLSAEQIVGPEWIVEDINGQGIIDSSRVTINFTDEGRIHGRATCNQYMGGYTLSSQLTITQLAGTKMACAPALMNQENNFTRLLPDMDQFVIDETGALRLSNDSGETITARANQ